MRRGVFVCAAIVCAATGGVVRAQDGTAAPAAEESAYAACVHAHSGRIRVVYAVESCRPNETRIPWSIGE